MKKIILTFTTALALMFPVTALADGNKLLKNCLAADIPIDKAQLADTFGSGQCFGLIQGVRNTMEILSDSSVKACFPKGGITNGQARLIVLKYLKAHPADLHENEIFLIISAYMDAYPCK